MNDHKKLLQGGMQEENRAKKPISASPTMSCLTFAAYASIVLFAFSGAASNCLVQSDGEPSKKLDAT
ncbi:hypothetical protein HID58_079457 [Brassica napus]|uniref:Uncharacterized protein n=1 Tax=Brassica napus TaxID=3708 RepID=A0ABQ7Y224_BRANA|nr:hypothetical protein HID58_079457 [Brassica napus]